jgi:hypothetical protein
VCTPTDAGRSHERRQVQSSSHFQPTSMAAATPNSALKPELDLCVTRRFSVPNRLLNDSNDAKHADAGQLGLGKTEALCKPM